MKTRRYIVMGAGEVGVHLARTLASEGHRVTVIDRDPEKRGVIEDQIDARFVWGSGADVATLEQAEVHGCDLFIAASSSDEANLAASLLAKRGGAQRTVVRVSKAEDTIKYGRTYEEAFKADLLLSTQLLTTTRILNTVLGYNTLEIDYLAGGALQIRRIRVEADSALHEKNLEDVDLPKGCIVLAYLSGSRLVVPGGKDRAQAGDDALVIATADAIDTVERRLSGHATRLGLAIIGGGGATAVAVAQSLRKQAKTLKIIESDRQRAEELAARLPDYEIVHGDITDASVLESEGVASAQTFLALTGGDETNLMACLLAQELGARQLMALVQKSETSTLWRKVGLLEVVSPRIIAAERVRTYIEGDYEANIVSLESGGCQFIACRVEKASPAAGATLSAIEIPEGLVVAAVLRHGRASIPRGDFQLAAGDDVIVFVRRSEADLARLLFPGGTPA